MQKGAEVHYTGSIDELLVILEARGRETDFRNEDDMGFRLVYHFVGHITSRIPQGEEDTGDERFH